MMCHLWRGVLRRRTSNMPSINQTYSQVLPVGGAVSGIFSDAKPSTLTTRLVEHTTGVADGSFTIPSIIVRRPLLSDQCWIVSTMSFLRSERSAIPQSKNPDEEYDMFNYDEEISDDDNEQQFVREGILLQDDQPQPPNKKFYMQTVSKLMKSGRKTGCSSTKSFQGRARRLVSHDHVTTVSPELADVLGSEGANYLNRLLSSNSHTLIMIL
jgi:hypothetical protein